MVCERVVCNIFWIPDIFGRFIFKIVVCDILILICGSFVCIRVCLYIYIYIERERERVILYCTLGTEYYSVPQPIHRTNPFRHPVRFFGLFPGSPTLVVSSPTCASWLPSPYLFPCNCLAAVAPHTLSCCRRRLWRHARFLLRHLLSRDERAAAPIALCLLQLDSISPPLNRFIDINLRLLQIDSITPCSTGSSPSFSRPCSDWGTNAVHHHRAPPQALVFG
jgi:hypothetical protein